MMKLLLTTLCAALLSFNNLSHALVDPDSLDPGMSVMSYLIPAQAVKIASYKQGTPSHLKVILCNICTEKTYLISASATFKLFIKTLDKSELTASLLKKNFAEVRLAVDREKGEIIYLHLGASANDELSPQQDNSTEAKR